MVVKMKRGKKSLRKAAKEIGVSNATLHRVEHGHCPDVPAFCKFSDWLGIGMDEFRRRP